MAVICVIRHGARFPTNTSEVEWFKRQARIGIMDIERAVIIGFLLGYDGCTRTCLGRVVN